MERVRDDERSVNQMAKANGRLTAAQRRRVTRIQASLKRLAEDDGMSEEALDEKLDAIEDVVDEADDELKKDDKDMEKEEKCDKRKRAARHAAIARARAARRRRASEVGDTAKEQFDEVDVVTDEDGEPKVTSEEEMRVDARRAARRARAARAARMRRRAETTDVTSDPENEIVIDEEFDELEDGGIMEDTVEARRRAARYLMAAKRAAGQLPRNVNREATVKRLASRYTVEQLRTAARNVNRNARTASKTDPKQVRVNKRPSGLGRSTRTARRSNGNDEFLFY